MRRLSWRAERKASRGGASNAVFVRAAVASLPRALTGIADEVTVNYPWGSLLRAIVAPDRAVLRRIAGVGRPGAALRVRVNESALAAAQIAGADLDRFLPLLRRAYLESGVALVSCGRSLTEADTAWSARVLGGRSGVVLAIDGMVQSARVG